MYRGENIHRLKFEDTERFRRLKVVRGDVRDRSGLEKAVKDFKPEIVFHLASIAGVRTVITRPLDVIETNVIGTYNLVKAVSEVKPEKVVYTSTSEVYGQLAYRLSEDTPTVQGSPYDPRWSYATSKSFIEHMLVAMERQYGISLAIGRLFNVYGPMQIGEGAIHNFIVKAINNEPMEIYGDGSQIRAWCYVDDCVDGLMLIAEKGKGIFNIGNPYEALSVYSLALMIKELTGSRSPIKHGKKVDYSDVAVRVPNIERLQRLNYRPRVGLKDGLMKTIQFYRQVRDFENSSRKTVFKQP
jgi:dTDP-glucose 4,6-dehydratase